MTNDSELEKGVNEPEDSPIPSNVKIVSIKVENDYTRQKKLI